MLIIVQNYVDELMQRHNSSMALMKTTLRTMVQKIPRRRKKWKILKDVLTLVLLLPTEDRSTNEQTVHVGDVDATHAVQLITDGEEAGGVSMGTI